MEKLRISRKEQFCNRLLKTLAVVILFFAPNAFAITPAEIQKLTIRPESDIFFTNQELKYVLEIPGVLPADVQTQLQENMKEGVTFISSRRMEFFTNDDSAGTRIEFWFSFKNTGEGEIPPLIAKIKGRNYFLPFEKIQLYENPKTIAPRVFVELNGQKQIFPTSENGKKTKEIFVSEATKPIELTVYIQYTIQIKQFGYEIPRDSLFEEIKRYEIVYGKPRTNEFSQEKIPVIKFLWTPLKEGTFTMPNVRMLATAYSGRSLELALPECTFQIGKASAKDDVQDTKKSVFAYALSEPEGEVINSEKRISSEEDFSKIAELRSRERHSFGPVPSIRKARRTLERRCGIVLEKDEQSLPLWQLIFIVFVLSTATSILLFIMKKKIGGFIALGFAIILAFHTLILGLFIMERHAVVKGGTISPVPEDSALSSTAVTAGTCVTIKEETNSWYYIEYNENGGWIKKENLILVK